MSANLDNSAQQTEQRQAYMREAIQLSVEKMEKGFGGPFGAVVVRGGEILARGFNNVLSSNDPTAHAEVDAIRKAAQALNSYDLSDCELYTSCEPCPMCLGAIYWARLQKVYYGNTRQDAADIGFDDALIYEEIEKPIEQRKIPMQQLLPEEAKKGFKAWAQNENRQNY
jgi:tRNA(Arg) A34 adenosine deaminase TadA